MIGLLRRYTPRFERIRRTNEIGNEYWSSRDFAQALNYTDYRNFEQVKGSSLYFSLSKSDL